MSKKIGMVAFRSSASGMSVISNIGPTMPGMKQILFWPEREQGHGHINQFAGCTGPPRTKPGEREKGGRTVETTVNTHIVVYPEPATILNAFHILTTARDMRILPNEPCY